MTALFHRFFIEACLPPPAHSKLLCVREWTKPPYSFTVAASLFGLCHVPSDTISGVHWPALASLATRDYFRPTLDGSSLVMPA